MNRHVGLAILAGAVALFAAGCGPKVHTVECKITLDGQPLEGATVNFVPQGDQEKQVNPTGLTDANGVAKMKTGDKEGVPPGTYKVTVIKSETVAAKNVGGPPSKDNPLTGSYQSTLDAGKQTSAPGGGGPGRGGPPGGATGPMGIQSKATLPVKYANPTETPFDVTVPTSGQVTFNLESK